MTNRPLRLLLAACALAVVALPVGAGEPPSQVLDAGRFVVFSHGDPVATEDFQYEVRHDTLFVTSRTDRHMRTPDGTVKPYMKSMELIAHADDWAMLTYISTEKFDGKKTNRMILPSDTAVTVTTEKESYGSADKLERLPGRVYAMDPGLFTLFDVVARNLHGRIFGPRPVALVTLGDRSTAVNATATPAGRDTIRWGAHPLIAERIDLADSTSSFTMYLSREGHMIRLENGALDLVVMREPPAVANAPRRKRPPR